MTTFSPPQSSVCSCRLGDIASVRYGKARPANSGDVPVIGSGGVYAYTDEPLADANAIVVGRKGTAGRVIFPQRPSWPSDTTFFVEPDTSSISPAFLALYLQHANLSSDSTKTTMPSLQAQQLTELQVDLPDLQEQRRIVRILSTIQSSDASRRSESAHLAEVRRSLIEDFFSKAERTIRLSSLIERPQYGFTASASQEGALRFLRITDIQDQGINWDAVPSCDPLPPAGDRYELEDGDLVVARIGATTGKAWLIRNPPASVFASYLIRIRARSEVDPRFLSAFFETRAYWSQIDSAKGSRLKGGVNIENLNSLAVPYLLPSSQRSLGEALDLIMLASNAVWKSAFATSALFDSAMANLLGSVP